jgi:hypothetical protein
MNKSLEYTANDWFYLKSECATNSENCKNNKEAVNQLRNSTDKLGSMTSKYEDAKVLYNRELLYTINMIAGLALIFYYIYVNQTVLFDMSAITTRVASASTAMRGMASSVTSNLSMRPAK